MPKRSNGRERHQRQNVPHHIASSKYMKNYDPNKKSWYLMDWVVNNLYWCVMSYELLVYGFEWRKDLLRIDKAFMQNYDEVTNNILDYPKDLQI